MYYLIICSLYVLGVVSTVITRQPMELVSFKDNLWKKNLLTFSSDQTQKEIKVNQIKTHIENTTTTKKMSRGLI